MSESGWQRRANAGGYLYVEQKNRTQSARILAKTQHDAQVVVTVGATEEEDHFDAERWFSPVTIDASNNRIDFVSSSGGSELNATVESGVYSDPKALAYAIERAMTAADPGAGSREYIVSWDGDEYKFTISHIEETTGEGDYLDLLWLSGTNGSDVGGTDTSVADALGYDDTADDTGAMVYTADNPVGSVPSWTSKPSITIPAQGEVWHEVPAGKILRFKSDGGQVELNFYGNPGFQDPSPVGRFNE